MKRSARALIGAVGCVLVGAGCSVAGSWRLVSVDPPGAPFPIESLTLDARDQYTATCIQAGRVRTETGEYQWNGRSLSVRAEGMGGRTYPAKLQPGGHLVLTHIQGGVKIVATLAKVNP